MEFVDNFNRKIGLSNERWNHITDTHPETKDLMKELEGTLTDPELIKRSVYNENVALFIGIICIYTKESTSVLSFD